MADAPAGGRDGVIVSAALQHAAGTANPVPGYLVDALAALDRLTVGREQDRRRAAEAEAKLAGHSAWCGRPMPMPPTPLLIRKDDGLAEIRWPEGRPEWTAITPEALEAQVHTLNAYRQADLLRQAWRRRFTPWRWFRG